MVDRLFSVLMVTALPDEDEDEPKAYKKPTHPVIINPNAAVRTVNPKILNTFFIIIAPLHKTAL